MSETRIQINHERLQNNLLELAQIGATPDGGVSRTAMSEADVQGREWFQRKAKTAGLVVRQDTAGNLSAIYPSKDPDAKTVMVGSHLDTVPNGGRYDGALGVLVGLEVVQTLKEHNVQLLYHVEAISFTDEEGMVFSMLGSRAMAGLLSPSDLEDRPNQAAFEAGIQRLGLDKSRILNAARPRESIQAFIEVHIEQGKRLESSQNDIGVVTSVVGIRTFKLHLKGVAAHAGTMPMDQRQDAMWAAAQFITKSRQMVQEQFSPGVMNCGEITIANSASNIVPSDVQLTLEFRHGRTALLNEMQAHLLDCVQRICDQHHVHLLSKPLGNIVPAHMNEGLIGQVEQAAHSLGLKAVRLLSFAGHDTQSVCRTFPGVMLFIPSVDGISHNPKEFSHPQDIKNAGDVMLQTVLNL